MGDDGVFERFLRAFDWHSSPIDWCEPNYAVSSSIVEYYNTMSNAVFVVLPCLLLYLFHPFARGHSRRVQFIWLLHIVIGACSAYFHSTLSLAGQLLDEFAILWVFGACLAFWMPRRVLKLLPGKIFETIDDWFEKVMLVGTVVFTVLGCFWPAINSFFLMVVSLPVCAIIIHEISKCRDPLGRFVAYKAVVLWFTAVAVWLSDRFFCGLWRSMSLPGGHWLWHLIVAFSTYHAIVFVVFTDASKNGSKQLHPVMRLWPSGEWRMLGIAYVELKTPLPEMNGNVGDERCKNC